MKISREQINREFNSILPSPVERTAGKGTVEAAVIRAEKSSDSVRLSTNTEEFKRAVEAVKRAPEVRKDRVEELKKAIAEGRYKIDSMAVAEKMLGRILVDRLMGQ